MKTVAYIVLGALVVSSGSVSLGAMLLHGLKLRLMRSEALALSFLTGSALFSALWMALGVSGLVYRSTAYGVSAALVLGAAALGSFRIFRGTSNVSSDEASTAPGLSTAGSLAFAILFLPFLAVYVLYALHPEVSADGSYYHNGFLNQYAIAHRIVPFVNNFYAALSQATEIQALPGFLIGKQSTPGVVQLIYLLAITVLIVRTGSRMVSATVGWTAAFLFFATPVVGYTATQALNDVAVSAAVFGTFYCLYLWWQTDVDRWLLPAGLLAGLSYATKYSAFLTVVSFAAVILVRWRQQRHLSWAWVSSGVAAVAVMAAPYLIRNWLWYGNPVAPFYNAWFPNPNFSSWAEAMFREKQRTYGWLTSYWDVPWNLAVNGQTLQGIVGPVVLLLPFGLLALRKPGARVLLLAGGICVATYPENVGARFLLPALPFFYLLLATSASRWRETLGALLALHAVLSWPAVVRVYAAPQALILAPIPTLAQVMRTIPEEETLAYRLNTYYAARWLDQNVRAGERVFAYSVYVEAYTRVPACVVHTSTHCFKLADIFESALGGAESPDREWVFHFDREELHSVRLVQTGVGRDRWNLREVEFYQGDERIPVPAGIRTDASRNSGDLRYLFDGNLVTGWSPWEFANPGQYVDFYFSEPLELDRMVVRSIAAQDSIHMMLYTKTAGGDWRPLSKTAPVSRSVALPDLRKPAMAELYRRGYRYLFAMNYESYVQSLEGDPNGWAVEKVASGADWSIFRILPPSARD
ncbi:MAG: glycosyltransferase family 39 protein [Bryobacterales bacterium]|nr:glycosyltransferase family 39 protein [Bryobacterales bacterium]